MKGHLILAVLFLLIACGKEETKKKTVFKDQSALQSQLQTKGVAFGTNALGRVLITCSDVYSVSNQQKVDGLVSFKNSIGLNNSRTLYYTVGATRLSPVEMSSLLSVAIQTLSYANPSSTICPNSVLAMQY